MNDYALHPRRINAILVVFCGISILGIIGFLIWLSHSNDKIMASQNWPSTNGVVISTRIKMGQETVGAGNDEYTVTVYVPALDYAYTVGSQKFISEKITVDSSWGLESFKTREAADDFLRQNYPVGTGVVVFYDPDNPRDAFLFKKEPMSTGAVSAIMYGSIAFLAGIMIYVLLNLNKPLR